MKPASKTPTPDLDDEEEGPLPSVPRRTYAWVRLYETGQPKEKLPSGLTPGRPPRPVPTRRTSVTFSTGDEEAVRAWQARLTPLLGRKPSFGETMGILARVCAERYDQFAEAATPRSLAELVNLLIGGPEG